MAIAATMSFLYTLTYGVIAYLLPGYMTFKAIEKKGPEDVREWAEYWVVFASFICVQWLVDFTLSWLPFYYIAKLGGLLALWHPSTRLASALYAKVFDPLISSYEADIDKFYVDSNTRMRDMAGQHAATLKTHASTLSGQAATMLKNIQQKAMERAKASRSASDAAAGLHAE